METHRLAGLGFLLQAAMHVGFVTVNLTMFGQPGYALASGVLALLAVLSSLALRHGWEDHAALLAWSLALAAAVVAARWMAAELGQPLGATSPLALLLPVGHAVVATAGWSLWRGFMDPGNGRALRRLAWGSALLALASLGFAAYALALGGLVIGPVLVVGAAAYGLQAWAGWRASATPPPLRPPVRRAVRNG